MIEPNTISFIQANLNAMIKMAGEDFDTAKHHSAADPESFAMIVKLLDATYARLPEAAASLHAQGYSWTEIGAPLGLTKAGAFNRFVGRPAQQVAKAAAKLARITPKVAASIEAAA